MDFPEDFEFGQILDELLLHLPKAKNAIEIITEELKRGFINNWDNFRLLLSELFKRYFSNRLSIISSNKDKFVKISFSVLTAFSTYKCSDLSVIADVLELLCLTKLGNIAMYNKAFRMGISCNGNTGQTCMSALEKILISSYKDAPLLLTAVEPRELRYGEARNLNLVKIFTISGEVHILKAIISFGATPIVPQDVREEHVNVFFTMMLLFEINKVLPIAEWVSFKYCFYQNLKSEFNEGGRKRLFFVYAVLSIFYKHNFHTASDEYIQCARIFIGSTPEPFITSEEIKKSITKLCSGNTYSEKVPKFLEMYESYFPESCEVSTPRSLRHLSRFQVRESFRTARSFPHGVESLDLPKKIQDYICFKDILL